jgi:hypothetical protein
LNSDLLAAFGLTAPGTNPVHPNAILILQLADRNGDGVECLRWVDKYPMDWDLTGCLLTPPATAPSYTPPPGATSCSANWLVHLHVPLATEMAASCAIVTAAVPPELATDTGTASPLTGDKTCNNWYPINMYDTREVNSAMSTAVPAK